MVRTYSYTCKCYRFPDIGEKKDLYIYLSVKARKPVQLLTRMSPQACTAAWSCCRRTPYRRHH